MNERIRRKVEVLDPYFDSKIPSCPACKSELFRSEIQLWRFHCPVCVSLIAPLYSNDYQYLSLFLSLIAAGVFAYSRWGSMGAAFLSFVLMSFFLPLVRRILNFIVPRVAPPKMFLRVG